MSDQDLLMMDVTLARFWLVPGWLAVFFFLFFFFSRRVLGEKGMCRLDGVERGRGPGSARGEIKIPQLVLCRDTCRSEFG